MQSYITLFDAFIVTVISMVVVYFVLILIAFLIKLLGKFNFEGDAGETSQNSYEKKADNEKPFVSENISEEEYVVISAAFAKYFENSHKQYEIVSVKKRENLNPEAVAVISSVFSEYFKDTDSRYEIKSIKKI